MRGITRRDWTAGFAAAAAAGLFGGARALAARTLTVAVPTAAAAELVKALAGDFQTETGIAVGAAQVPAADLAAARSEAAVVLAPERVLPAQREAVLAFASRVALIGLRGDRARVRGLRTIDEALRWIATSRSNFIQSSEELGVRAVELAAWERIGVDVVGRPRWYDESRGNEVAVAGRAADFGAYTMLEEATWAGLDRRRGLEIMVVQDPRLQTPWISAPLVPSQEAAAWQAWIVTDAVRERVAAFRFGGTAVFFAAEPAKAGGPATD